MNSFQLIELNNHAVASMQQGKPKEAIELLRIALADLKEHFYVHKSPATWSRRREPPRVVSDSSIKIQPDLSASSSSLSFTGEEDDSSFGNMDVDDAQDQPSVLSVPVEAKSSPTEEDSLIVMYTRALIVFPDVKDRELITGVCLYNMALVNHRRALARKTSSLLSIAHKLYDMAASIMENKDSTRESEDMLLLAVYNNLAQIHSTFFSPDEMSECLDKIRSLLTAVTDETIDEDEYTLFFINSTLQAEDLTSAPAA